MGRRRWNNSRSHREIDRSVMPFGKHKGKQYEEVPTDYFIWILSEGIAEPWLESVILQEMKSRKLPTEYLLFRMDSQISDDEFGTIAEELDRRGTVPGWGIPISSSQGILNALREKGDFPYSGNGDRWNLTQTNST